MQYTPMQLNTTQSYWIQTVSSKLDLYIIVRSMCRALCASPLSEEKYFVPDQLGFVSYSSSPKELLSGLIINSGSISSSSLLKTYDFIVFPGEPHWAKTWWGGQKPSWRWSKPAELIIPPTHHPPPVPCPPFGRSWFHAPALWVQWTLLLHRCTILLLIFFIVSEQTAYFYFFQVEVYLLHYCT